MKTFYLYKYVGILVLSFFVVCSQAAFSEQVQDSKQARVESVQDLVNQVVDEDSPVDFDDLIKKIEDLPTDVEPKKRRELMRHLGRMLVHEKKLKYSKVPLTGCDPNVVLQRTIVSAFNKTGKKEDVAYLQQFYEQHGDKEHPKLVITIMKLGGSISPQKRPDSTGIKVKTSALSAEEKERRRIEVQKLAGKLKSSVVGRETLDRSIQRIGEIGEAQDVPPIIKRLQKPNTHWVVKQNAYNVLGKLGGGDAVKYLLDQLKEPISDDAKLDDYGDSEAILRAQAALALGECGGPDLIGLLTELAEDGKQFERVRQACRKAVSQINRRLEKEE